MYFRIRLAYDIQGLLIEELAVLGELDMDNGIGEKPDAQESIRKLDNDAIFLFQDGRVGRYGLTAESLTKKD